MNFWMQMSAFLGERVDPSGCGSAAHYIELDALGINIVKLDSSKYTSLSFLGTPDTEVVTLLGNGALTVSGVLPDGWIVPVFSSLGQDGVAPLFDASTLGFTEYRVTGAQGLTVRGASVTVTPQGSTPPPPPPVDGDTFEFVRNLPGTMSAWRYRGLVSAEFPIVIDWTNGAGGSGTETLGECDPVWGLQSIGQYQLRPSGMVFTLHGSQSPQRISEGTPYQPLITPDSGAGLFSYHGNPWPERAQILRHAGLSAPNTPQLLDRNLAPSAGPFGLNLTPATYGEPAEFSTIPGWTPVRIQAVSLDAVLKCGSGNTPLNAVKLKLPVTPFVRLETLTPGQNYFVRAVRADTGAVVGDWAPGEHSRDGGAYIPLPGLDGVEIIVYLNAPGVTDAQPGLVAVWVDSETDAVQLTLPVAAAVPGADPTPDVWQLEGYSADDGSPIYSLTPNPEDTVPGEATVLTLSDGSTRTLAHRYYTQFETAGLWTQNEGVLYVSLSAGQIPASIAPAPEPDPEPGTTSYPLTVGETQDFGSNGSQSGKTMRFAVLPAGANLSLSSRVFLTYPEGEIELARASYPYADDTWILERATAIKFIPSRNTFTAMRILNP